MIEELYVQRTAYRHLRIVERTNREISEVEIAYMQALAYRSDPSLPSDYVREAHIAGHEARFYLTYADSKLVGMQSYSTRTVATPFSRRPLTVFRGHLTYKDPSCRILGITARVSYLHVRRMLGAGYLARPWLALAHSPNPRLYVQFRRSVAEVHPDLAPGSPVCSSEVRAFVSEQTGVELDPYLVDDGDPRLSLAADVTERFDALYKTRNDGLDKRYFDLGIFERRDGRILLSNRSLFIVAVYRPMQTARFQLRRLARLT